jgi:hypothetical protein
MIRSEGDSNCPIKPIYRTCSNDAPLQRSVRDLGALRCCRCALSLKRDTLNHICIKASDNLWRKHTDILF